ncbi:MAG: hypothetical protein DME50_11310 [Verrucomicrobia bacterium]|nr:MAG: hypothetical protein DME50_11310 [Verrucomicrobiota bacterium]
MRLSQPWILAGRTIFVADAHRGDGERFLVRADEKFTAFLELEVAIRARGFSLTYVSYFGSLGTQKQSWIGQGHQFLSVKRLAFSELQSQD